MPNNGNPTVSTKVIVTNHGALKSLYGQSNLDLIESALATLIGADQRRQIQTQVINLDEKSQMDPLNAPVVTNATDDKQNKNAIDGVYNALKPDYLAILGALDIVPMQTLDNPIGNDGDTTVPSDLPYACAHGYSKTVSDFKNPSRVVGRIPGVTGNNDVNPLIDAINVSASLQERPKSAYSTYLGISAQVWQGSTQQSLDNIFGNHTALHLSPPDGPNWTDNQLAELAHFVNCHGSGNDPQWYGQQGGSYPVAVQASQISGKLQAGTIATAECCYGGQLYNPGGICNVYSRTAAAFCGSSNIAYGPASGQGEADLMTQYFLINLLALQSAGAAMLGARQRYVAGHSTMSPYDLKTLAQFNLLGDPSSIPVKADPAPAALAGLDDAEAKVMARKERRQRFAATAAAVADSVGHAVYDETVTASEPVAGRLNALLEANGLTAESWAGYRIEGGAVYAKSLEAAGGPEKFIAVTASAAEGDAPFEDFAALVATEQGGVLTGARLLYRR